DLRVIFAGGEKLNTTDLPTNSKVDIVNIYGPTEAAVVTTFYSLGANPAPAPPIGRPISNALLYVLSSAGELVPRGAVGELYIGGAGVARGYLNLDELTAISFIKNPYVTDTNKPQRLYKTGDLVRYLADGNLEFVDRVDSQVKIRGFRIELGEIEQQLLQLGQVKSAVVVALESRLVAYFTSNKSSDKTSESIADDLPQTLREQLLTVLPDYMVPVFYVALDVLPLTPNGKVNYRALPKPLGAPLTQSYVAPTSDTEKGLAEIFAALLNLKLGSISANANFFDIGGHSLLSIRLVAEVRSQFAVELAVKDIFEQRELASLAAFIDHCRDNASNKVTRTAITAVARQGNQLPTSFAQARLWFIDAMDGSSAQYNMPLALSFKGHFDDKLVEQAFARIIERHEPLRTVFVDGKAGPEQVIRQNVKFELTRIEAAKSDVHRLVIEDATKPFDLANDLMLRSSYIRLTDGESTADEGVLLFNTHHIASDGWSMGLLTAEFWQQYQALATGQANPLTPLPVQYGDYAQWQQDFLKGDVLDLQLDYWDKQLIDLPQVHSLPLDRPRPGQLTFNGATITTQTSIATLERLNQLASSQNVTLFMLLHGVFSVLLARHSNNPDIVLGVPMANRMQKELEDIIGFFVNTLVLRTQSNKNVSFVDYLVHVKQVNLDAQANQDVPFEDLVERLKPSRSTAHSPLYQILFSMNTNTSDEAGLEIDDLILSGVDRYIEQSSDDQPVVAKFELTLTATTDDDGLCLDFNYNQDLFD
ncbi:MAG: condensation domain-containing protein, partial [Psychrosphaera sp.]|nr:condensation domain-containing protein [Psychrosphaera sp.]